MSITPQASTCFKSDNFGDARTREIFIARASERLERLAPGMLRDEHHLRRWVETGDILTETMHRLYTALANVELQDESHFWRLAAREIRRILIDLARRFRAEQAFEARHPRQETDVASVEPNDLEDWTRFHEAVEDLPDGTRTVFELYWYDGLSQKEIADQMGISVRTVKRHWQSAQILLHAVLSEQQ